MAADHVGHFAGLMAGFAALLPLPAPAQELTPFRVGIAAQTVNMLPMWMAETAGLFRARGLKVEIVNTDGGSRGLSAVSAGMCSSDMDARARGRRGPSEEEWETEEEEETDELIEDREGEQNGTAAVAEVELRDRLAKPPCTGDPCSAACWFRCWRVVMPVAPWKCGVMMPPPVLPAKLKGTTGVCSDTGPLSGLAL